MHEAVIFLYVIIKLIKLSRPQILADKIKSDGPTQKKKTSRGHFSSVQKMAQIKK
jgi:hypothetical protein